VNNFSIDFLMTLRTRSLDLNMLADAVLYWRENNKSITTCMAFRCFNKGGMPKSILQLKNILDYQCVGWDKNNNNSSLKNSSANIDKSELKHAIKFIINSRSYRGSISSRDNASVSSNIFAEILKSVDFNEGSDDIYGSDDCANQEGDSDPRLCLSDKDYYKSIIGDLDAMQNDISDYLRASCWEYGEAKLTIRGLIDFCKDYSDLKRVYSVMLSAVDRSGGQNFDNIINLRPGREGVLACDIYNWKMNYNIYHTNKSGNGSNGLSVAYHLEPYNTFEDFSSATRVVFHQIFKSYKVASVRRQKKRFFELLYGGYCIDTRIDKIFKEFLAPQNFVEDFYTIIQPLFNGAVAYNKLIGFDDSFENIFSLLKQCCLGITCKYNDEIKEIDKNILVNFLKDMAYVPNSQSVNKSYCYGFFCKSNKSHKISNKLGNQSFEKKSKKKPLQDLNNGLINS